MIAIPWDQLGLAVPGIIALWLVNSRSPKWAPVFGLLSEPCWFYTSYKHQQWGVVFLTVVYTFAWARGIRTHWSKRGT